MVKKISPMGLTGEQDKANAESSEIILETSLQCFFFDQLTEVNKKSLHPLPQETIFYSSTVMDKYSESGNYFENVEGHIREKILGLKFLESQSMSRQNQKRILNDIGDTALFMCGYFSESTNKKLVDSRYYMSMGIMAYERLHHFKPDYLEIPCFYLNLSRSFATITLLIGTVAQKLQGDGQEMIFFVNSPSALKVS
ncbi:MAG: hypothetical protein AABY86_09000 [Bdellovibrionota bacterium]|mgnify:CR=1 FL=1